MSAIEDKDFNDFLHNLLLKPSWKRQLRTDSEQKPRAPTSIAKKNTDQPLDLIEEHKVWYFSVLTLCHSAMFSSQGDVSSIITTFFVKIEKSKISGRSVDIVKKAGMTNLSPKSKQSFQSEAELSIPECTFLEDLLGLLPCLIKFMKPCWDELVGLHWKRKSFNAKTSSFNIVSCQKVNRPCDKATLHAPNI